jgi:ABC-type sulfate transport system substrate-binding protein
LVASKIKEVKVKREEEVDAIFPTFEIKEVEIVIPTFVIKLRQVEEEEVVKKKVELNGMPELMQEYIDKYSHYIYYRWVQQSSFFKSSFHSNSVIGHKFPILPTQRTLKYNPILGTSRQLMSH